MRMGSVRARREVAWTLYQIRSPLRSSAPRAILIPMDAPLPPARKPRRRSAMAMLIVLVASIAILFRVWRDAMEASPASGLIAGIRTGPEQARILAMEGL